MPLIHSPLALAATIALATAAAFLLDRRFAWFSKVGASLLVIVFGALLSNLGLVPAHSPVYDGITGPVTSLAIVWLLLAVHIGDLRQVGPRMLGAFGLAVVGTLVGVAVGGLVFRRWFGTETPGLVGAFTGTYIGGSLNFVSVGRSFDMPGTLFAGATAADALTTGIWLGACLALPVWLRRFYPAPPRAATAVEDGSPTEHPFFAGAPVSVLSLAVLFAVGLALVVAAKGLSHFVPAVPSVVWLTTLALVVGHTKPFSRMDGAMQLGNYALHLFFVVIGIYSRIADILQVGVAVFFFTVTVVVIHGLIVFGLGRLLRLDLGSLSVASQAAVGGPSSALAVAVSRDWPGLILPGIVVGLLGYAIGTYLGFGMAWVMR